MSASPYKARVGAEAGPVETWSGLHGSALAIALRSAAAAADRVTLVLTRSSHQAQMLHRDLVLLAHRPLGVLLFPDH